MDKITIIFIDIDLGTVYKSYKLQMNAILVMLMFFSLILPHSWKFKHNHLKNIPFECSYQTNILSVKYTFAQD